MADKVRYPQIPSTVWWGVRSILKRTPSATIDERFLSIELNVQEAAARAYVSELKSVGVLNDDCKATPTAQKWRLDDSYKAASEELIKNNYPESLLQLAEPNARDRAKAISWFEKEGLGTGAARNKAAAFVMIGSDLPGEQPAASASRKVDSGVPSAGAEKREPKKRTANAGKQNAPREKANENGRQENIPLNINVQIHISADAGAEQIEAIFSAMKRYLHDKSDH